MLMQDIIRERRATELGLSPSASWKEISQESERQTKATRPSFWRRLMISLRF